MTNPIETDPALNEALSKSREKSATGGASKATIGLAGAVLLAGGFFGGYAVKSGTTDTTSAGAGIGQRAGGFPRGNAGGTGAAGGGNATFGTISSVSGNTVTVKTAAGNTVSIKASSGTKVTVNKTGKVSDLSNGDTIVVQGKTDSNGNVTADSIAEGGGAGGMRGGQAPGN